MLVCGVHVDSSSTSLLEEVPVHCYCEALQQCLGWAGGGAFRMADSMLLLGRPGKISVGCQDLLRGGGLTTGRQGSVSLDVGGGFLGRAGSVAAGGSMSVSWAGLDI